MQVPKISQEEKRKNLDSLIPAMLEMQGIVSIKEIASMYRNVYGHPAAIELIGIWLEDHADLHIFIRKKKGVFENGREFKSISTDLIIHPDLTSFEEQFRLLEERKIRKPALEEGIEKRILQYNEIDQIIFEKPEMKNYLEVIQSAFSIPEEKAESLMLAFFKHMRIGYYVPISAAGKFLKDQNLLPADVSTARKILKALMAFYRTIPLWMEDGKTLSGIPFVKNETAALDHDKLLKLPEVSVQAEKTIHNINEDFRKSLVILKEAVTGSDIRLDTSRMPQTSQTMSKNEIEPERNDEIENFNIPSILIKNSGQTGADSLENLISRVEKQAEVQEFLLRKNLYELKHMNREKMDINLTEQKMLKVYREQLQKLLEQAA